LLQLEAIEGNLTKSFPYFERKIKRWYSKTFSTPLHEVNELPWDWILLNYYEDAIENQSYNEVFDLAVREYLPEFVKEIEDEDEEFANSLVEEQRRTLRAKKEKEQRQSLDKEVGSTKLSAPQPQKMALKFEDEDLSDDPVGDTFEDE
jgi:hypothetical protein